MMSAQHVVEQIDFAARQFMSTLTPFFIANTRETKTSKVS